MTGELHPRTGLTVRRRVRDATDSSAQAGLRVRVERLIEALNQRAANRHGPVGQSKSRIEDSLNRKFISVW